MRIHYSVTLEEIFYSKDKTSILANADATLSRKSGFDIETSIRNQFPDKEAFWCAWHGNPECIAVVFSGDGKSVLSRALAVEDRNEEDAG